MSANSNDKPDNLAPDPLLARAYAAAADEAPPATLDAAILAAARREVSAGPRAAVGAPAAARPGSVRKWYVPMSVAAVLVLSVSLVTLMREEKGDELYQPPPAQAPRSAESPPAAPTAQPAPPAAVSERSAEPRGVEVRRDDIPARAAPESLAKESGKRETEAKQDAAAAVRDVAPAQRARAQATPQDASGSAAPPPGVTAAPDSARNVAPPPAIVPAPAAPAAPASAPARPPAPAGAPQARSDPFPGAVQPETPAGAMRDAAPAVPARAEAEVVGRLETPARPMAQASPAPPAVPAKPSESVSLRARQSSGVAPAEEARAPAVGAASAPKRVAPFSAARPAWLAELDNQPSEKWLERLAEFRREGRTTDADALLAEFRKRFPDHPMSR